MLKLIEMKCDCGPRYKWAEAETLWVPELGLLQLSGGIDFKHVVSFATVVNGQDARVEIKTGLVRIYYRD